MQALLDFLAIKYLIPLGYCLNWNQTLLWLHVASDAVIVVACYLIALSLACYVRQRKDLAFPGLYFLFALFVFAIATTHLLSIVLVWIPLYWLAGYVKVFTAMLAIATAVLMVRVIPLALKIPSEAELQAEKERGKKSENQFRTLIENLRVGITLHDAQTKVQLHNPYTLELLDLSSEQLLNKAISETGLGIFHEDGSQFLRKTLPVLQAIKTRRAVQNVVMNLYRPVKKDRIWLLVTAIPQFNDDSSLLQVICTFIDITRRKEAEQRLKQSESYFRNTFQLAPIGVVNISLMGRFLEVNHTFCTMLGYSRDELIGMNYRQLVQVKDQRIHLKYIQQLLSGGIFSFSIEKQYICKNKRLIWCSLLVRWVRCTDGGSDYIIATLENIDERKRIENDMIATRNQLQATLNAVPDLLLELGLDGHCYDIYTKYNDLLNTPSEQLIGKNICDFMSADACGVILSALQEAEHKGQSHGKQFIITHPEGNYWVELSVASKPGSVDQSHFVVLSKNITHRKLVELQLSENEDRFNLSQEYGGIGTWEADLINNRQFWSKATYQLVGLPVTYQPNWEDFLAWIHPDDRQHVLDANKNHLTQGKKYDIEYRIILRDGLIRWMRSVGKAEFNTEGKPMRFIGIVQDITDRKIMEAELKRSNADLEQFAYAISHDMRQPLRMVTSYLTLIENALKHQLDEELQQFFNFAIDGAKRMDAMILSLLEYSRVGRKHSPLQPVSSRSALDEALKFLKPELQANGGSIKIFGDWIDIAVNGDELTRLLQNLIGNALKYHQKDQPPLVEVSALSIDNVFKVTVRDHGIGIDNQYIDQLFKVFSRLNPRSEFEGTGVGLALCRKIIEFYNGKIGIESAGIGQGSVFWFELPILPAIMEAKK